MIEMEGTTIADIKDVARLANVSIGTVSNAFKHPEKVAEKTRNRIFRIAEEIGFFANPYASALVTSQTNIIGVLVSYSYAGRHGNGIYTISREAAKQGYNMLLSVADMDYEKEKQAVDTFIRYKVDGVIIYADYAEGKSEHFRKLTDHNIPCVVFKRYDKHYENIVVSADKAFRDLASQLKQYQHSELGVLMIDPYLPNGAEGIRIKRMHELQEQLAESGIAFPEENILIVKDETVESGKRGIDEWLSVKERLPTVFLCFYDKIAVGAMNRLIERGYRIPQDVSMVAYGSGDSIAQLTKPSMATISMSEEEMLKLALDALLDRIRNPQKALQDYQVSYRFSFNESLGPAPKMQETKEQ